MPDWWTLIDFYVSWPPEDHSFPQMVWSCVAGVLQVLSLIRRKKVTKVTEGVGQPKVSRLDVLQWRVRRNDRLNFVERALYKMGLIALKMYEFVEKKLYNNNVLIGTWLYRCRFWRTWGTRGPCTSAGCSGRPRCCTPAYRDIKYGDHYYQHFYNIKVLECKFRFIF